MKPELYYVIADSACARVRKWIDAQGLLEQVRYRNIVYPEVLADLAAHGGSETSFPALWDGQRLHVGEEAVIGALKR